MSETIEILNFLSEKFGIMIDWTQQNVQPYIQDLMQRVVQYNIAISIAYCVIFLVLFIIGIAVIIYNVAIIKNNDGNLFDAEYYTNLAVIIVTGIALIAIILLSVFTIFDIIQYCMVPEKIFIQELQSLMG